MRRRLTYRPNRSAPPPPTSDEPEVMGLTVIAEFLSHSGKPRMADFVRQMKSHITQLEANVQELAAKLRAYETPQPYYGNYVKRTGD